MKVRIFITPVQLIFIQKISLLYWQTKGFQSIERTLRKVALFPLRDWIAIICCK